MTKAREPLTYQHTLLSIAQLIGWDRCAAICGVRSVETVRLWSDPDCETEIRMIDAERLDRAFMEYGGDHAPFHRLHALRLDLAARETVDQCLVELAGEAAKETGEAVAALIKSITCRDVRTSRRTRQEIQEAIDTLTDVLAALDNRDKARAKGDRP